MITKHFGKELISNNGTLTLYPAYVLGSPHSNGWVITGKIKEDWFEWVDEFEAVHPKFGKVWGAFDSIVFADSEEGFNNFIENFPPEDWDPRDI